MVTKRDWLSGKWVTGNKTYLLYNHISDKQINGDAYKIVFFDIIPGDIPDDQKAKYRFMVADYREEYVDYLKTVYPKTYNSNNGISAMIDAIKNVNQNLICLYKNKKLVGALSYTIFGKIKKIDVDHLGVIEQCNGYGKILMIEIFKMAKIFNYDVTVTSNGFADGFYKKLNMIKINDKPLSVYKMFKKQLQEATYEGRHHKL